MAHIFILYRLKAGVSREDFESWLVEAVSATVGRLDREKVADGPRLKGLESLNGAAIRSRIAGALNHLATTRGKIADNSPFTPQKRETNGDEEWLVVQAVLRSPVSARFRPKYREKSPGKPENIG